MVSDLSIASLQRSYREKKLTPTELVAELQGKIQSGDPTVWISLTSESRMKEILVNLEGHSPDTKPLFGIPFAIKDNIDLKGNPTTAACPDYSYDPDQDATVVRLLIEAGAIPMGKTNLDQFATGLVGVRSPYGVPQNPFHPDVIPGGSSSGSAVSVSSGQVTFSLGTDTAGSGRVPAGLNELIGIKPTFGKLSCRGVVPACRSLDCVSIFAKSPEDGRVILSIAGAYDSEDAYSRPPGESSWFPPDRFSFGVPRSEQLKFFGDDEATALFDEAVQRLESIGGVPVEIDFSPFHEAALLLYEGPWVSERYAAIETFLEEKPDSLYPVTRTIISGGGSPRAVDAFRAQYRLRELKKTADGVLGEVDFIVTPTAGTAYTVAEVEADPITLNSNLGYYTNFMNLLDYCALAIPAGRLPSRDLPWGITLFAFPDTDLALLDLADRFLGRNDSQSLSHDWVEVAVCGAHMRGLPLNHQLSDRGAHFLREDQTEDSYSLFALPPVADLPPRPGLIRNGDGSGASIALEVWAMPASQFGSFVEAIPAPLGFGKVLLAGGRECTGFLCESVLPEGSEEITGLGGWRAFLAKGN
ncbi:MAG: allophanate hydrolase [Verrucomicrobiota bacterium]